MRIHWFFAIALLIPIPVVAQKKCAAISDRTATREVVPPPLAGIRRVVVETTISDSADTYSALTKLGEWHVRKAGLEVVDSLNRADALLHVALWPDAKTGRTEADRKSVV